MDQSKPTMVHTHRLPLPLSRRHVLTAVIPGVAWSLLRTTNVEASLRPRPTPRTQRYEDLTASEMVSMTVGLDLRETDPHKGQRIMELSLDLEHLIAVIDVDPAKITAADRSEVKGLRDNLTAISGVQVRLHILGDFTPREEEDTPAAVPLRRRQLSPTGHQTRFGS